MRELEKSQFSNTLEKIHLRQKFQRLLNYVMVTDEENFSVQKETEPPQITCSLQRRTCDFR